MTAAAQTNRQRRLQHDRYRSPGTRTEYRTQIKTCLLWTYIHVYYRTPAFSPGLIKTEIEAASWNVRHCVTLIKRGEISLTRESALSIQSVSINPVRGRTIKSSACHFNNKFSASLFDPDQRPSLDLRLHETHTPPLLMDAFSFSGQRPNIFILSQIPADTLGDHWVPSEGTGVQSVLHVFQQ